MTKRKVSAPHVHPHAIAVPLVSPDSPYYPYGHGGDKGNEVYTSNPDGSLTATGLDIHGLPTTAVFLW
jgi:hypothetical protein